LTHNSHNRLDVVVVGIKNDYLNEEDKFEELEDSRGPLKTALSKMI